MDTSQFTEVQNALRLYNEIIWPLQIVFVGILLGALAAAFYGHAIWTHRILALAWFYVGLVFFGIFLSQFQTNGYFNAVIFCAQAVLLATTKQQQRTPRFIQAIGCAIAIYAAVLIPILALQNGIAAKQIPWAGTGAPTTVMFTIGVLMILPSRRALPIPIIWSFVFGFWAIQNELVFAYPLIACAAIAAVAWAIGMLNTAVKTR